MIPVEGAGWSCLPAELLLKIFHSLKEVDFVTASSTCSNWRRVFHESPIWKRRVFDLSQPSTLNLKRIAAFVACTGCHLKDLRIIRSDASVLRPKEKFEFLDTLLSSLSNLNNGQTSICCFHVEDLTVDCRGGDDDLNKVSFVTNLARFIQRQSNLQVLHLNYLDVERPFDNIIFQSIVESPSFKNLKILQLVDFNFSYLCMDTFKKHGLRGCNSLEELAINYSLLSTIVFDHLWSSSRETLKLLHIYCTRRCEVSIRKEHMMESARWRLLEHLFPRMRVLTTIVEARLDVSNFLVEGIPLVGFSWRETRSYYHDLTDLANKFLDLLVQFYSQTLRFVSLDASGYSVVPVSKERVCNLLRSSPNLSEVSFSAWLMNQTLLEEIANSVVSRAKNVDCIMRII